MVKFVDVDPSDIPNVRESHRGRVSYPIVKSFMETGKPIVMLDRTGMQQSLQSLYSSLRVYIQSHELPIKLFSRSGQIYLMRTDLDDEGNYVGVEETDYSQAAPVTAEEVSSRFDEEKNKTTK